MEELRGKHLVVLTGGTGLAPVRSLLNMAAADPGFTRSVHLVSGFKNEAGIVFRQELEAWRSRFRTLYALDNDPKEGWRTGLVPAFHVAAADTNGAGDSFLGAVLCRLTQRGERPLEGLEVPELEEILTFANRAAALTCTRPGAISAMPALKDVLSHP